MKSTAQSQSMHDVVICGAGPVGLFLACELALAKCSVLILEKEASLSSPFKRLPFGIRGLSAPTIEALDRRGLLGELELHKKLKDPHKTSTPEARAQPRRQGGHFAGIPFLDVNIDSSQWKYRLPSSTETSLISEMHELETVLCRRAQSLGVEILRGLAVTDFHQSNDTVLVRAGAHSFKARWLVGCDGARSVVRKQAGFEFAGTDPEFTGYSVLADIVDASMLKPGRNVTEKGMYMQSQPDYIIMQDFDGGEFHHSKKPLTLQHVQDVLRRISATDVTLKTLHAAATWTDRARQATAYRDGRILLAGDAAHIHAPLGGQGLNLGLGDAMNLGWKLAAVIKQQVPESLLETYQSERHPIGVQVLDWSRAQVAVMKPNPQGRALNAIFRDLISTRDGATYFAGKVRGISTHYGLGTDHDLVGHSVPNFEFEDGATVGQLLREGQGLLIDFDGKNSLESLAFEYGNRIKYVCGRAKEALGFSAVLVRPDGIIAWATRGPIDPIDPQALRQAASLWWPHTA